MLAVRQLIRNLSESFFICSDYMYTYFNLIPKFCCCVSDLYHDEPEKSDTRMRGDLHSRVNQRRSKDRMNEGMFGSHVSRSVYTTNTEDIAKQRGLQLCTILHDVINQYFHLIIFRFNVGSI